MKKIILLTTCIALLLTGCSNEDKGITGSSEPTSSVTQSSDAPSEPTSSLPQSSEVSSELTPSAIENSSVTSSDAPSSAVSASSDSKTKHNVKSVSLGSGYMTNPKINYNLSKTEIDEFVKHWKGLKLEFSQSHKSVDGTITSSYGDYAPCDVEVTYTDKKEVTYFSFYSNANYYENYRAYKITSGAEEMFKFLSDLDCYKKADVDLYTWWIEGLEANEVQSNNPISPNTEASLDEPSSSKVQIKVTDVNGLPVPDVGGTIGFMPPASNNSTDIRRDYAGTTDHEGVWAFSLFKGDLNKEIVSVDIRWNKPFKVTSTSIAGKRVQSAAFEKADCFEAYTGNGVLVRPAPDKTVVINIVIEEVVPQY